MKNINFENKTFGKQAVVIGASIAGMIAGRILADYFENVIIIERDNWDHWTEAADFRKGVPQARHPHVLLKRGELILEELFPGLVKQLNDLGAISVNTGKELAWMTLGNWRPSYETKLVNLACSRPMLETGIRRRLASFSNVSFKIGWEAVGLLSDPSNTKARALKLRSRDTNRTERLIPANLIVDASGRESKAPEWLKNLGFKPPRETVINAYSGYATRIYRRPENFQGYWKTLYVQPNAPKDKRGGIITPLEGNRWHVTLIGMNKDYPPTDEPGFLEYARSMPTLEFYDAIKDAKALSPIIGYRNGSNRLRHYATMPAFLENFVALGDSVYAFNPVYGQGMTIAAMAGMELEKCLRERREANQNLTGLAEQFQKRLLEVISLPWQAATSEDMRWPSTTGAEPNPDPAAGLMQNYMAQVLHTTTKNPVVTEAFYKVMNMLEPPTSLFRPNVVLLVAAEIGRSLPGAVGTF